MKTKTSYVAAGIFAAILAMTNLASAQSAVVETRTTDTTSAGTITEFSPDTIVIRSETSPQPLRYTYSKTTTYVDEAGNPVSMEVVKSGLPVTVQYTRDGERLIASRVIVRRHETRVVPAAPVIEERKTTVVPTAPVIEEKKTTTTTTTTK